MMYKGSFWNKVSKLPTMFLTCRRALNRTVVSLPLTVIWRIVPKRKFIPEAAGVPGRDTHLMFFEIYSDRNIQR